MRIFTLDGDLDEKATFVPVGESTADVSNIVGFSITNSVVVRIDDELMVFESASDHSDRESLFGGGLRDRFVRRVDTLRRNTTCWKHDDTHL